MVTLGEIKIQVEKAGGIPNVGVVTRKGEIPIWRGMYCKLACELTDATLLEIGKEVNLGSYSVASWRDNLKNTFLTRKDIKNTYEYLFHALWDYKNARIEFEGRAENIVNSMLQ